MKRMPGNLLNHLLEQLDELRFLIAGFERRRFSLARSISVKLRLLLRGSSGDAPLVGQVLPGFCLPPLRIQPRTNVPDTLITLPSKTYIDSNVTIEGGAAVNKLRADDAVGRIRVESPFDLSAPPLPIREWGDQALLRPKWTLFGLIEAVAHSDGGAHIKYDERIDALQRWGFIHWHLICRIATDVSNYTVREIYARTR